mgnify:CR=1 FL=1
MENNCTKCNGKDYVAVILKVVDYCNFVCDFCRYPNNENHSAMAFSTYKAIVEKVCDYNLAHGCNHIQIIYHGGEPLLWNYQNYVDAIALQKELTAKYPSLRFKNNIQTNGSLLNQQWIDFFKANNFNIGISIDGPDEINFHKNALGNHVVLDNIRKLSQEGCKFGILSVITNEHAGWADRYYDFLVENNIHSVGLCYCVYDEDKHITVNNNILTEFLQKFFIRYFYGNHKLNVREFESVIKKSLGAPSKLCTFAMRHSCGNYFSIRPNGDVQFCDPFTLGKPAVGNILTETFNDIKNKPDVLSMINRARIGVRNTCDQCEIRNICGGGCFRHTIDDGSNVFCETFKAVYPYIEKIIHAYKEKDNPGCIHPSRLVNLSFKTFDDEDGHKIGVQEDINIDTGEIRQIYKDFDSGEIDYVGY